jgi:hypothetical protein
MDHMPNSSNAAATADTMEWPRGVVAPNKSTRLRPLLEPGERILWTGHADIGSTLRTQLALWWFGMPWTIAAIVLASFKLIPADWQYLMLVVGGVFLAAPFLLAFHAGGAIYAITDRRAIIKRDALGQKQTVSVPFDDMDKELEVLTTHGTTGHLYFASKMSTKLADADYDGKLAFRELPRAGEVADLLNRIRHHGKKKR